MGRPIDKQIQAQWRSGNSYHRGSSRSRSSRRPNRLTYAELCYQARPTRQTLERYRAIVFESADFMASFAFYDEKTQRYVLGPPLIPAQENHPPRETWNPTFELAYWRYGLRNAQRWRERLGLSRNPVWDRVITRLSALPG